MDPSNPRRALPSADYLGQSKTRGEAGGEFLIIIRGSVGPEDDDHKFSDS